MDHLPHPGRFVRSSRGRFYAGIILCALVVVFSLAAKVSWYHKASSPAPSISKLKAFKGQVSADTTTAAPAAVPVPLAAIPVLLTLAALFAFELCGSDSKPERRSRPRTSDGFFSSTVARPPPAN